MSPTIVENGTVLIDGLPREVREQTLYDWVPVGRMFVDAYARPVSEARVKALAENWDIKAVNTLVVSLRDADGRFAVIDGNHRRLAAERLEIAELPCRVCIDLTYEQEADLFNKLNTTNKPTALDRFRARIEAGDPTSLEIRATLRTRGLDVAVHGPGPGKVQAVYELERIHGSQGATFLREVVDVLHDAFGDAQRAYSTLSLGGMAAFWVRYRTQAERGRVIDRLKTTGPDLMLQRAGAMRAAIGTEARSAWGRALHALYNQGLRNHQLPEWQDKVFPSRWHEGRSEAGRKSVETLKARGVDLSERGRLGGRASVAARRDRNGTV